MTTQWQLAVGGLGGAVYLGLRYESLAAICHLRRIPAAERPHLFAAIQDMELAALPILNEAKPDG